MDKEIENKIGGDGAVQTHKVDEEEQGIWRIETEEERDSILHLGVPRQRGKGGW